MKTLLTNLSILLLLVAVLFGCESEKRIPPKGYIPNTSKATEQLEAQYFWIPQDKLSSNYWKNASYVEIALSDLEKNNLYGDGFLNMTGTYRGLSTFNKGNDPQATIKAGYDDTYLYILVEWKDTTANASYMTWKYDGPEDKYKDDSTGGWTSQKNQDNVTLLFDQEDASGKDAWRWSLAYTAPFDMALNLNADANGILDEFEIPAYRNADSEGSRVGPLYEWNGITQQLTTSEGATRILDPAYYLLDDYKSVSLGNVQTGQNLFNNVGNCNYCHGTNGDVSDAEYPVESLNGEFLNKYSREGLKEFIISSEHEGSGDQYWGRYKDDSVKTENLIAFLRGIAGSPGYVLEQPEQVDVSAISNIIVGGIQTRNSNYQVLFKRKLKATDNGDVSFSPDKTYTLSIQLSDNDEINYVGASEIELVFKSKEL